MILYYIFILQIVQEGENRAEEEIFGVKLVIMMTMMLGELICGVNTGRNPPDVGVAKFQAGLSQLKSAEKNILFAALGNIVEAIQPQFLSILPTSIPSTAATPKPNSTPAPSTSCTQLLPPQPIPGKLWSHHQLRLSV